MRAHLRLVAGAVPRASGRVSGLGGRARVVLRGALSATARGQWGVAHVFRRRNLRVADQRITGPRNGADL